MQAAGFSAVLDLTFERFVSLQNHICLPFLFASSTFVFLVCCVSLMACSAYVCGSLSVCLLTLLLSLVACSAYEFLFVCSLCCCVSAGFFGLYMCVFSLFFLHLYVLPRQSYKFVFVDRTALVRLVCAGSFYICVNVCLFILRLWLCLFAQT